MSSSSLSEYEIPINSLCLAWDAYSLLKKLRDQYWNKSPLHLEKDTHINLGRELSRTLSDTYRPMQVPSAIVIRKEYVVLYEILENREGCMSMCGTESGQPRYTGHIVTGNPGIGKSVFLVYALLRQLVKGNPVALQAEPDLYWLFHADGVSAFRRPNALTILHETLGRRPWILCYMSCRLEKVPQSLTTGPNSGYHVIVSDPDRSVYKRFCKYYESSILIMDLWTKKELTTFALVSGYDLAKFTKLANRYGPNTRELTGLMIGRMSEKACADTIDISVGNIIRLPHILDDAENLENAGASSVAFIRPHSQDRSVFTAHIPTEFLLRKICKRLEYLSRDERQLVNFFHYLSWKSSSRSNAAWLFETWMHTRFRGFSDVPIIQREQAAPGDIQETAVIKSIPNKNCHISGAKMLKGRKPGKPFYWQPGKALNIPDIDAILYDGESLHLLRSTIAHTHSLTSDGFLMVDSMVHTRLRRDRTPWIFVFVGNEDTRIAVQSLVENTSIGDVMGADWANLRVGGCIIDTPRSAEWLFDWIITERPFVSPLHLDEEENQVEIDVFGQYVEPQSFVR